MSYKNEMKLKFLSLSENEGFARLAVASFCACKPLDIEVITDIKTAVSEAVTNSVVHAYPESVGEIEVAVVIDEEKIEIEIQDEGVGIENVDEALKPFFTSKPEMERSGMGFTVMEGFMDKMEVTSILGKGTTIKLVKNL